MRLDEPIQQQLNAIEFINEAAKIYYRRAFGLLQTTADEMEQLEQCEEMELWQSVQILIDQRQKLEQHLKALVGPNGYSELTLAAAQSYLESIGAFEVEKGP